MPLLVPDSLVSKTASVDTDLEFCLGCPGHAGETTYCPFHGSHTLIRGHRYTQPWHDIAHIIQTPNSAPYYTTRPRV